MRIQQRAVHTRSSTQLGMRSEARTTQIHIRQLFLRQRSSIRLQPEYGRMVLAIGCVPDRRGDNPQHEGRRLNGWRPFSCHKVSDGPRNAVQIGAVLFVVRPVRLRYQSVPPDSQQALRGSAARRTRIERSSSAGVLNSFFRGDKHQSPCAVGRRRVCASHISV